MDITVLMLSYLATKQWQDIVTVIVLHAYNSSYIHVTRVLCI